MELGTQIEGTGQAEGEHKPMKAFHQLKTLEVGHVIEGIHQGMFESKKKPGYFFHVLKAQDGESYAYGSCQALNDRITEVKDKEKELGGKIYTKIVFNGRLPSKKNPAMTYYSFSSPVMFPVIENKESAPSATDIPF
jgi:hypothetical protein